jgi:wyosine [tRNA(Phe)-imidazoG37] synthetase (radical SAM superfamily)
MLDKAIRYGKEKRKPYRKSKSFDRTCRNHGSCSYCERNRTYQSRKEEERVEFILKEDLS